MQSPRAIGQALSNPPPQADAKRQSWFTAGSAAAALVALMLASGCAWIRPYVPPSEGHIGAPQAKPEPETAIPPPARISSFVPPPKPALKPQTYSVVVNEVPVKELLLALARDTRQNIDIDPSLSGLVSLNAIDETLPAILERLSKQVNLRYRVEGNAIIVSPDTAYSKTYRINYVNMIRNTNSVIGVSGQVAAGVGSGAAASAGSQSLSSVTTTTTNDFWKMLETNVRAILASSLQQSLTAAAKADRMQLVKQEQDLRVRQLEAASKAQQGAPQLAANVISSASGQQQASLLPDDVIVNPVAGTLTITATEIQHKLVQDYLVQVQSATQRQVLIEATIVEVTLSEGYQGGIDFSRLQRTSDIAGFTFSQALSGGFSGAAAAAGASAGNALTIGLANNTGLGNIAGSIKLLQEFGNTRVLSSPKLMALNNQTALLKVVDNIVYFEVQAQTTTSTTGPSLTTFNTTAKTVSVGMVMGVTPQISDDDRVSLTVRPTISKIIRFKDDPNPSLVFAGQRISNPVPEIQVREMESVLQVGSGQTVILGGLMQDNVQRDREQLPGADSLNIVGEAFRFRNERATKTELVIFLRPTVIKNPSLESEELKFFQRFLPQPEQAPAGKTGAAR